MQPSAAGTLRQETASHDAYAAPGLRALGQREFMNPLQVEYFRQKLLRWRADLIREADGTLASLSEGGIHEADITDRASVETDRALELRTRDRARKLISKIDQALVRVESAVTDIARRPASRSGCGGWRRGRSRRYRWKPRSGTSAWSACTATIEVWRRRVMSAACMGRRALAVLAPIGRPSSRAAPLKPVCMAQSRARFANAVGAPDWQARHELNVGHANGARSSVIAAGRRSNHTPILCTCALVHRG